MKKILILTFLSVFFFRSYTEEVVVNVSAKILTPLKIEIIQHISFGDIFKGGKNFNAKDKGELKVIGDGRVRLLWKDISVGEFQSMNKNLSIIMSNGKGSSFNALISPTSIGNLDDFTVGENLDKVVKLNGKIEKLDNSLPEDDYNGAILVRAEYIID